MEPTAPTSRAAPINPTSYLEVFRATPYQRVNMIKAGLRARDAKRILDDFAAPLDRVFETLKVTRTGINRRAARDQVLSAGESERILGLARLVGQVQSMASSDDSFDASAWLAKWLLEPVPALGGQMPVDLLDTMEGQGLISNLIAQMQSGAYA